MSTACGKMGLKTMTLSDQENGDGGIATVPPLSQPQPCSKQKQRRRAAILTALLLVTILVLLGVILGVTVFRVKEPRTQLVSASVEGIAPRISFPAVKIELNITLNLTLLVQNRNHASFKGGGGEGVLVYQGHHVGEAHLDPGLIPARGAATLFCILILEVDRFADSGLTSLINDIMAGQLMLEIKTRIPGRVNFLGIFRKHIVSMSDCQIVIGFPDLKIKSQDCKHHTKL